MSNNITINLELGQTTLEALDRVASALEKAAGSGVSAESESAGKKKSGSSSAGKSSGSAGKKTSGASSNRKASGSAGKKNASASSGKSSGKKKAEDKLTPADIKAQLIKPMLEELGQEQFTAFIKETIRPVLQDEFGVDQLVKLNPDDVQDCFDRLTEVINDFKDGGAADEGEDDDDI